MVLFAFPALPILFRDSNHVIAPLKRAYSSIVAPIEHDAIYLHAGVAGGPFRTNVT